MRLYRYHITNFLQILFVLVTLNSCVYDKYVEDSDSPQNQVPDKTLFFMSLKFVNTSGDQVKTLADSGWGNFEKDSEHIVGDNGNYILLLNDDKSLYGVYPIQLYEYRETDDKTEEAVYSAHAKFYHDKNEDLPKYCLVVLNANETISSKLSSLTKGCSIDKIYEIDWEEDDNPKIIGFGKGNGDDPILFTMTNSVYVENGNVIDAQEISESSFATSLSEAKKNAVKVYVERMVAKFEFSVDGNVDSYTPQYNGKDDQIEVFSHYYTEDNPDKDEYINGNPEYVPTNYKIKITGWGINALEKQSKIFKNIKQDASINLKNFHTNSDYHHSCWSEDPNYDKRFSWQYLEAVDVDSINYPTFGFYDGDPEKEDGDFVRLKNYPLQEFVERGFKEKNIIYVPENTYGGRVLTDDYDGRTNLLAGTHFILCAQLEIGDEGATNVYRDRIGYYYYEERECFAELVRRFNNALASQDTMRYTYCQWPINDNHNETRTGATRYVAKPSKGGYQLYYKDKPLTHTRILDENSDVYSLEEFFIPATVKDGDGRLIPWIKGLSIQNEEKKVLQARDPSKDNKNEKGEIELAPYDIEIDTDDIISLLYEWTGAVDYFNGGKMYYAAPVKHYAATMSDEEADQNRLGDYGVVRNHWYKFDLKGINTIGIPIANFDNVIVPNSDGDKRQLNLKVEILDWHEIETTVPIL